MAGPHITVDATVKDPKVFSHDYFDKFFWDMLQNQGKTTSIIVVEVQHV